MIMDGLWNMEGDKFIFLWNYILYLSCFSSFCFNNLQFNIVIGVIVKVGYIIIFVIQIISGWNRNSGLQNCISYSLWTSFFSKPVKSVASIALKASCGDVSKNYVFLATAIVMEIKIVVHFFHISKVYWQSNVIRISWLYVLLLEE